MNERLTNVDSGLSRPTTVTDDGSTPTSSHASRRAASINPSSASTRPPGNDISPLWLLSVSVRRVSRTSAPDGPSASRIITADTRSSVRGVGSSANTS